MRGYLNVVAVGVFAFLSSSTAVFAQDKSEWIDLMGNDLRDWTRTGVGKSPWRLTTDRTLICGTEVDGYTPDREFLDGTIRFEYRFRPTGEKTGYRASLLVRRTASFAGCKIALGDECGTLSGSFSASSDSEKVVETRPVDKLGRPAGEWNEVHVRLEGKSVHVTINGKEVGSWHRCSSNRGLVIFDAEGSEIEFRSIFWKDAKPEIRSE
jgi:hypothetical protein